MGTARSGSTILEILLASAPQSVGGGELTHLLEDGFLRNRFCSCGLPFADCPAWTSVRDSVETTRFDLYSAKEERDRLDWHDGVLRVEVERLVRRKTPDYDSFTHAVMEGLAPNDEIIVDSSKYAGRLAYLASQFPGRVRAIWLTRGANGLLGSFSRNSTDGEQAGKSPMQALAYAGVSLGSSWLAERLLDVPVFHLRFERLLSDPSAVLAELSDFSGIDLAEAARRVEAREPFDVGHIITGNRLRKRKTVVVESGRDSTPRAGSFSEKLASRGISTLQRLLH